MTADKLTLLIPEKPDVERDAVAEAWGRAGGTVTRIGRFWDPPPLERAAVRLYGSETFCLVLAQKLGLELVAPPDDLIFSAPETILRRTVQRVRLVDVGPGTFPAFVKSLIPKQFASAVYPDLDALANETAGLSMDVELIVAEPVDFLAEARAFVVREAVQDCAVYEGAGDVEQAKRLAECVAESVPLPVTAVVDVGLMADGDWCLIEFNATWGSGLNGCDPELVIPCLEEATRVALR